MPIELCEENFEVTDVRRNGDLLHGFADACRQSLGDDAVPVRFVVSSSGVNSFRCEVGVLRGLDRAVRRRMDSIFELRVRRGANAGTFNSVLLIPTGIGAEIGGHAGDAGPVARLLGEICDTIILHPNVVNASDVNEMPDNSLYVEGSVLTRLLMGTVALQLVRSNRVLVVMDEHDDDLFVHAGINTASAARASYGLRCPEVVLLESNVKMRAESAPSGRATGKIENLEALCELLVTRREQYDAVALSSVIHVRPELHQAYFHAGGNIVNPWGGVEAMLTHALSSMYNIPTAHSPMLESREVADLDPGIVDSRMAAEAFSTTFLQCTLKGLQRSPQIVRTPESGIDGDCFQVEDVSCLVLPSGCLGLPTLAALEQGIPVIAVRENANLMNNDLSALPWKEGQFQEVDNYWEAAGVVAAMRAGIDPTSVRRPLADTVVSRFPADRVLRLTTERRREALRRGGSAEVAEAEGKLERESPFSQER